MNGQQDFLIRTSAQRVKYSMRTQSFAYVAPSIGVFLLMTPLAVLGGIYAKYYAMPLTTIAIVMLVARIFDAITDPLIGYYSDHWRERSGTRKPLILIGALGLIGCSYFLFTPPSEVNVVYFTCWYMAFYLALTIFYIPYLAWANEFTESSKDRLLVFSLMGMAGRGGMGMFYLIPLLPFFMSTEVTLEILRVSVFVGGSIFLAGLFIALRVVPDGPLPVSAPRAGFKNEPISSQAIAQRLAKIFSEFMDNRPFVLYIFSYMCLGIGLGMWMGLFFIYVDAYLQLGEVFAKLSLWGMVCGALAIPVWYQLSLCWGKRRAWLVGMFLLAVVLLYFTVLRPGNSGVYTLFALNMLMTFSMASMQVFAYPVLCDVIDYGELKEGIARNALYFSIDALMTKLQVAIGSALGFSIIGWFGFDVKALVHNEWSVVGLWISLSWVPTFFVLLAMLFIALMPLNEKRMEIIHRRLDKRRKREILPLSSY